MENKKWRRIELSTLSFIFRKSAETAFFNAVFASEKAI